MSNSEAVRLSWGTTCIWSEDCGVSEVGDGWVLQMRWAAGTNWHWCRGSAWTTRWRRAASASGPSSSSSSSSPPPSTPSTTLPRMTSPTYPLVSPPLHLSPSVPPHPALTHADLDGDGDIDDLDNDDDDEASLHATRKLEKEKEEKETPSRFRHPQPFLTSFRRRN